MDELERTIIGEGAARASLPPDAEQIREKINEIVRWINKYYNPDLKD